jgi:hypothetical protein
MPYARARKHGDPNVDIPCGQPARPPMVNFLNNVTPSGPESCWEWRGSIAPNGYGSFHMEGKTIGAHRASHILHIGPLAPGEHVLHSCDNRKCVNPAHLRAGSHRENVVDSIRKNRDAHADGSGTARLTSQQVVEMRKRRASGETITALATAYGVSISTTSRAINGVNWRRLKNHITERSPR